MRKLDQQTVQFDLSEPYAAAERLFDSVAMLPRHLLEQPYEEGRLAETWGLATAAAAIAGLGPFRFKQYVPGERLVLERNPFYWKDDRAGTQLPYLDRVVFVFVPNEDAQAVRFQAGEADVTTRLSATNFEVLLQDQPRRNYELTDLGASVDYTFLVLQPQRSVRPGAGRNGAPAGVVSAARVPAGGVARRSTATPSSASSIADTPRRCGDTCRPATSSG